MSLTFKDMGVLNREILDQMRLKLADKDQKHLEWPGKEYLIEHPADLSIIGSVGHQPNPEFTGLQSPNSMGMVVLVSPDDQGCCQIHIDGSFDIFHRMVPTLEDMRAHLAFESDGSVSKKQSPLIRFRRTTVSFSGLSMSLTLPIDQNQWISPGENNPLANALEEVKKCFESDPNSYRQLKKNDRGRPVSTLTWNDEDIIDQNDFVSVLKAQYFDNADGVMPWAPGLRVRARPAPETLSQGKDQYLLEVFLENNTSLDHAREFGISKSAHLLDVSMSVTVERGQGHPLPRRLEPEDYRYKDGSGVVGYGITTSITSGGEGVYHTNAMPVSELEKINNPSAKELGMALNPDFSALSKDPLPILNGLVQAINGYADQWRLRIQHWIDEGNIEEAEVSQRELNDLIAERDQIADGVALLNEHPHLRKCFQWMNESIQKAFEHQDRPIVRWHLFQLGFIMTQVRAIYERHCQPSLVSEHIDTAEVLWFSTGGGKTEAYLGIIVMAMFYERINGRQYGPTAWMKFPLRMLSVQQFQRLSYVIAQANIIQDREIARLKGHPFTIGYFTGSGTPNNISNTFDNADPSFLGNQTPATLKQLQFIYDCPYCDHSDSVSVVQDFTNTRIKHVCNNAHCWSNTGPRDSAYGEGIKGELGIYISDEEVYRYLPSVMVGTIDKLATISLNRRYQMFFGNANHYCPQHGFIHGTQCDHREMIQNSDGSWKTEKCGNNTRSDIKTVKIPPMNSSGIGFILQDELHLLKENMGNFCSHYETLMSSIQVANGGRPPKILSATATIKGYEDHIHHLYQRKARRFPVPGMNKGESFYSRIERDEETDEPLIRRLYAGVLPLGTGSTFEHASALSSMRYLEVIDALCEQCRENPDTLVTRIGLSVEKAQFLLPHLETYLNSCLVYVNSLNGLSHINRHLDETQGVKHSTGEWLQLDGKTPLDDILSAIRTIETKTPESRIRQILATSVVSHGVDMSRLNFMVVAGWPKSISEYLQSSARAGRVMPGIVLSIFASKSLFEGNVFVNFEDYHHFMDKMVESVPVNRFAPNLLEKTLPGIASGVLTNWAGAQWGNDNVKNGGKLKALLNQEGLGAKALIRQQIMNAMSVPETLIKVNVFDDRVLKDFNQQLEFQLDSLLHKLENLPGNLSEEYIGELMLRLIGNRPMRSMRDIESQVAVLAQTEESGNLLSALSRQ